MKRGLTAVVTLAALVPALAAQERPATPPPRNWKENVVHYGKWTTALAAVGLTLLAAHEHDRANQSWQQLLSLCNADNAACQLRSDGQYVDYQAELYYQRTLYYDHRARHRILGAQISVLTSATLFILDLRHHGGNPPNIPFNGSRLQLTAEPLGDGARVGMRLTF
ncbi:MAG TPA: hypothetical protein VKB63_05310 [Gemmatimonadales bacterium]|nr:hypothetical protein [Gemmatimonadales bacterium]